MSPDGNNIYYGYKSDADYSKDRIKIEVHYYSNMKDAEEDTIANQDPLGKFVHVKYTANLNSSDNSFDKWAFRPMWWYGVPAGLTDVHDINYSRFEKYTGDGNPVPSRPGLHREDENVTKHYANSKDWKGISNFYITDPSKLTSMNGLKTLLGIDGKQNNGYDKTGNTAGNWGDYYDATKGMQGMFVDWESAGKRFYQMTYVAELTDKAWKERNEHPLRFAAGVYRFAGNWHIATGQTHHAPKIADSLKVQYPALTPVAKADALIDTEKTSVENAIKTANKDVKHFNELLDKIEVANDGTATLTFHDKTTIKMPGKLLVVEEKKDNVKFPPVYPAPIGVVNPKSLSEADQKAIIAAFKKENAGKDFLTKVSDKDSDVYKFDNDKQTLTITYTDGSTITVPYSSLVYQGPKISDWAPYVVPDPIEVVNPASLTDLEKKQVTDAFDTANADLDVYTAAKKNNQTPVSFDKDFKNAIITWADGSTSTIPSWQFLTKKPEQAPSPKPPTPKPAEEKKTFTVDLPPTPGQVIFDPFDKTATVSQEVIRSLQSQLMRRTAKDANDPSKSVTIKSATINIANGTVTFTADGYADKVYPIGIFYKKKVTGAGPQNPTTQKDEDNKDGYKYKIPHVNIAGDSPTLAEKQAALKKFVELNYNGTVPVIKDDGSSSTITIEGSNLTAKDPSMAPYGIGNGHIVDVMVSHSGGDITINYDITPVEDNDDTDHSMTKQLFIDSEDIYIKKNNNKDNTIENLRKLAKQIRDQRKNAGELTEDAINTLGATDEKINSMNDEKALRDLIKKIADYQKPKPVEYKYNFEKLKLDHDGEPNDADYKKIVVEQFLKKNYTTDNTNWSKLEGAYNNKTIVLSGNNANTYSLTPVASGTSGLNIYTGDKQTGSVTSVIVDSQTGDLVVRGWKAGSTSTNAEELIRIKKADLYTPKSKEQNPTPSAEDLEKLRKQAKEIIDRNPKLTDKQKEEYKNKIDQADTKEKIQNILKEANKQGNDNNVNANDLKEKEKKEKEKREKEKREKEQQNKLAEDKTKAKETINGLTNLTDGESGDKKKLSDEIDNAQTPEEVKKILEKAKAINDARGALKEGALPFLSHGNANSDDDKALKELIGADPAKKDNTLTDLENAIKDISSAQTATIRAALDAATRQNGINEQAARQAANAKIAEFENKLTAAEKVLTDNTTIKDADKNAATNAINDAKTAIGTAKTQVASATTPSGMLTQLSDVETKFNTANSKVNDAVNNAQKENKKGNTNDPDADTFKKEKEKAKGEIDKIPGLTEEEKNDYKKQIDQSTHTGDPEAIVNRAKKNQKIKDALAAIDKLEHLNNAQKKAYEDIINSTDAHNIKDDDGKDTGKDDIDNALADAIATDHAMERLEKLKEIADTFANGEKYKSLQDSDDKKKAFNTASTAAGAVLAKETGDAKTADQVNELYKDLLKAMQAIDDKAKGAGVITDALQAEVDKDSKLKPTQADPQDPTKPATPGDPIYNTSSQEKKQAFDQALTDAENALKTAKDDNANQQDPNATPRTPEQEAAAQKAVDEALKNLQKAREELDGVNTKPLQDEIGKDSTVNTLDRYTYSTKEKKDAFDQALQEAKDLIDKLTGKKQAGTDDHLDTKENKQRALDAALKKLQEAEEALKGKKPVEPTPTPTPTPSVDKSHLQQGINDGSDVHNSDEYNNAPSDKKQAYDHALDHANEVNNDPNATQDQVNQATEDLKKAENDLKPTPSPLPTPVPGGHEDSGFGVNDNAPTTVDKGELNVQIDSAEADSQPGNAGAGNAGNTNAGAGANSGNASNANNANGANSAAVNAAVESNPAVKQADAQVSKAQAALDTALAEAKKVAADPNATQAQVDAAAQKLSAARKALASAKAHAAQVRASVRAQVLKSGVSKLSKTGSNVSVIGLLATVAAAGAAFFVAKRRGVSRHSNN
ncbi:sugar-binding protein [Gardnerella sp. Marseille-QA0894]|uniref:sugar-binding protein n=1 Tax=Gardnerella sp. Marseille-QA0894 TaxID=3383031 RepID=UPI003AF9F260